jgi:hypothetical protein
MSSAVKSCYNCAWSLARGQWDKKRCTKCASKDGHTEWKQAEGGQDRGTSQA